MKIAYIVDSTIVIPQNINNTFQVPFYIYDEKGTLHKSYNHTVVNKAINSYQKDVKSFIEPTPGVYRDLYKKLLGEGYEHILVIPNNKDNNISFKNARYASKLFTSSVSVIDSKDFDVSITDIIHSLQEDINTNKQLDTGTIITLDKIIDMITTALKSFKTVIN